MIYPEIANIVPDIIGHQLPNDNGIPGYDLYPIADWNVLKLSTLSSKDFRTKSHTLEDQVICLYKSGMALQPGEVINWTNRLKKLTSTRHKNIILRIAHGDLYTNDRLCRFKLINDPKCLNCNEPIETLTHRIITCEYADRVWRRLNQTLRALGLKEVGELSLENILGAGEHVTRIELAIQAEVALRLASGVNRETCPTALVKSSLKMILIGEKLSSELKTIMQSLT